MIQPDLDEINQFLRLSLQSDRRFFHDVAGKVSVAFLFRFSFSSSFSFRENDEVTCVHAENGIKIM